MKKLYFIQLLSIIILFLTLLVSLYYKIVSKLMPFTFDYIDALIYLIIISSIIFSYREKIISSFLIFIYSLYFFINFGQIPSLLELIYNSLFLNGRYQLGLALLSNLINLIVSLVLIIMYTNKISKKDGKKN